MRNGRLIINMLRQGGAPFFCKTRVWRLVRGPSFGYKSNALRELRARIPVEKTPDGEDDSSEEEDDSVRSDARCMPMDRPVGTSSAAV